MTRLLLALCIGIVLLDAIESFVTRAAGLPHVWMSVLQLVVYAALGFALRRLGAHLSQAVALGAATAAVDATAGNAVAVAIGGQPSVPGAVLIVVVPFVVLILTLIVLIGYGLGSLGKSSAGSGPA